jgi:hypothetical protein
MWTNDPPIDNPDLLYTIKDPYLNSPGAHFLKFGEHHHCLNDGMLQAYSILTKFLQIMLGGQ